MMFPGHPYLLQETRRAESVGERKERERVLRLIGEYGRGRLHQQGASGERVLYKAEDVEVMLSELRIAIAQGWQRF